MCLHQQGPFLGLLSGCEAHGRSQRKREGLWAGAAWGGGSYSGSSLERTCPPWDKSLLPLALCPTSPPHASGRGPSADTEVIQYLISTQEFTLAGRDSAEGVPSFTGFAIKCRRPEHEMCMENMVPVLRMSQSDPLTC